MGKTKKMTYLKETKASDIFEDIHSETWHKNMYLCRTLPIAEQPGRGIIHASKKYWLKNERVWYGEIPKPLFFLGHISEIYTHMELFFKENRHKIDVPDDYIWDYHAERWEMLPKLIWLTNEYIVANKNFKNPVCSHYNPRGGVINIHPGGCRQLVLHLFGKKQIPSFFFNTDGFYQEWMSNFVEVDVEKLINTTHWSSDVVADHGTLIPHLLIDTNIIPAGKDKWFKKIREKYESGWKIYIQNDLTIFGGLFDFLDDFITTNKKDANVIVNFDISDFNIWSEDKYIDVYRVSKSIVSCFADIDIAEDGIFVHHMN